MYQDADLHLASKRLLLRYQDRPETEGVLITDLAGNNRQIINNPYAQGPRWSPDGLKFAYFGDGRFYIHDLDRVEEKRVVELADHDASFCEWSPDGQALVFSAYSRPLKLEQPPNIYHYNLDNGLISQITNNRDVDRFPKWNNIGSQIACHRTYRNGQDNQTGIVIVELDSKHEQLLPREAGFSQRISRYCWSKDNQYLVLTSYREHETHLQVYQIATGELVWSIEHPDIVGTCFNPYTGQVLMLANDALRIYEFPSQIISAQLPLSDFATVKATLSGPVVTFSSNEEIVYFLGSDSRFYCWRIAQNCEAILSPEPTEQVKVYQREDYAFRASDGLNIPVQRYLPQKTNGRAVVFVEGGPGAALDPNDAIALKLLEEGYELIRPAYRGCDGYGDEHLQANRNQCGKADVRDVVEAGLDWKQRFGKFNVSLAIAGYSYGGYLAFLAMTHDDAPWVCGITFWGGTMIPPLVQTFGLPQDPESRRKALEERSPVRQAGRMRFPLLILHGEQDTTASVEEVEQIQAELMASGINCKLVIFENESHALKGCRPQMYAHTLAFLETNTK
jgi:dipeptidyl aminopeptidase/acylaminoacyl peptidase